jgi:hypothetical protein
MNRPRKRISSGLAVALAALSVAPALPAAPKPQPPRLVSPGKDGRLAYDADAHGNRVPDFSNCGYAGGNRLIPDAPVRVVVAPRPGDNTARIQKAIDYVGRLPADTNGLRGAVLLLRGRHEVFGSLWLTNSGVVLRGQGVGEDGTVLVAAGLDRRTLLRICGRDDATNFAGAAWSVADDYVPVGAKTFHVSGAGELKPGDQVRVIRPCTQAWIDALGATEFGGGEGDWRLTWKPGSRDLVWDRVVQSVAGNLVTVDAPLTTALEQRFGGGRVENYAWPGRITNVGVEELCLESACDARNPKDEAHAWFAVTLENAADAWVRQVTFQHFAGSAVAIYESCKQVTVEDCRSLAPVSEEGGYRRHTFFTMGQLTLFLRCFAEQGRHDFSVGHAAAGPNAFVQCEASLPLRDSGPIESWSSGVLYDNVRIDGNGLTLAYRGPAPNGAGWAAANSVLWNCSASQIRCENPPTAQNWAFGSWGEFAGDGIWRSSNDFVTPESLYVAQLRDRLGEKAAARVQLMPRSHDESSNPPLDEAQRLAAASHQPAPQLSDYIRAAAEREPIPDTAAEARKVDDIPDVPSALHVSRFPLAITNGWLTVNGRLLVGDALEVAWWRGNLRPQEAPTFGVGVTRFVPGRTGPGFTDDLAALADAMAAAGHVALDHHYGLWYERRRDDHERVRRMSGDVWPPFYEQPFARSGQGTAWDGLSRYDLTKFNTWYWSRLKRFADECDQRGLVLFHEDYFQHNILEAGAHWVDCPWRSANNINHTGFPEPPPFAGDKRIFQAELFYDETNPVRRPLHEGYIRQCLDNFTNNANVIQFTGAEFTGPLHFMQFWVDTVAAWERAKQRHPFIALSCTKDVQDAILADAKRCAVVDVIDFRYWWRTDKGEFAPPGGKNLAPRQFERQWRGGRPKDANLAGMAAEYRAKFPAKPLLCDFDEAGWAWLCAGGSLPRLPKTTDIKLLAAIPRMQPWPEVSNNGCWALREAGRQMLVHMGGNSTLDLSGETGAFRVNVVNPRTGEVTPGETINAGGVAKLPEATVVWLTKE